MGIRPSPPSMPKRFCPIHLVPRNFSKASAACEAIAHVAQVLDVELLLALALDLLLDPVLLVEVLDVHVLDADGPAVRIAQHPQDLAEDRLVLAPQAAGEELAVEVSRW